MIHDAIVEVTCDGPGCLGIVDVKLRSYDDNDETIEKDLVRVHEWIVEDGRHYCSENCIFKPAPDTQ